MEIRGYLLIAAVLASLFLVRKDELKDSFGNMTAKPIAWSWVCLVVAAFFFVEFIFKIEDPFYRRHPENFFAMWSFIFLAVLGFFFMRFSHVTFERGKLIEHSPLFWHTEIRSADLLEAEDAGHIFVFRSLDKRRIGLPKMYSGVNGVISEIRRVRPDLFKLSGP